MLAPLSRGGGGKARAYHTGGLDVLCVALATCMLAAVWLDAATVSVVPPFGYKHTLGPQIHGF